MNTQKLAEDIVDLFPPIQVRETYVNTVKAVIERQTGGELVFPTVHLNGTSAARLIETYNEAYLKMKEALAALEAVEFNGRDYYPQGQQAFKIAHAQHAARAAKIAEVRDELLKIVFHVQDLQG